MNNTINHTPSHGRARSIGRRLALVVAVVLLGTAAIQATASAGTNACGICGKNLIKNPGADTGLGITAVDAFGAVPGWTNEAGQFGAASWTFPNGWFQKAYKGPTDRGKNYFFGGTTRPAIEAQASIGKQTIKLPAAAAGKTATLSGWLGNYVKNTAQVRAQFEDATGKVLSTVRTRPGHDHLGNGHVGEEPERKGARRGEAGHDRRDVRGWRSRLQARRRGLTLLGAELVRCAVAVEPARPPANPCGAEGPVRTG